MSFSGHSQIFRIEKEYNRAQSLKCIRGRNNHNVQTKTGTDVNPFSKETVVELGATKDDVHPEKK